MLINITFLTHGASRRHTPSRTIRVIERVMEHEKTTLDALRNLRPNRQRPRPLRRRARRSRPEPSGPPRPHAAASPNAGRRASASTASPPTAHPRNHQRTLPHAEVGVAPRRVRESGALPRHRALVRVPGAHRLPVRRGPQGAVEGDRPGRSGLDDPRRAHEDAPHAPGAPVLAGAGRARRGASRAGPRGRHRVPVAHRTAAEAPRHGGAAPETGDRRCAARVPVELPGLDWAAECTEAPGEVCELALAHVNSDRVEAAYRRTDLFGRRRNLMQQWDDYIASRD